MLISKKDLAITKKLFYDEGWNARCMRLPFDPFASRDWKDGWKDCDNAAKRDRKII